MIESGEFVVVATLTIPIEFAAIERATPLNSQDAIDNAMGTVRDGLWGELTAEGWTVEFTAEKVPS